MKEVSIHVGQRIRLYRKTKNLTIETFAGMIHKSKATVSKYENGDISIDIETLFTIGRNHQAQPQQKQILYVLLRWQTQPHCAQCY